MKTLAVVAICLLLGTTLGLYRYQALYQMQKEQTTAAETRLLTQQKIITELRERQQQTAALDARYTSELNHAQKTIDDLQRDVAAGSKRLRLRATCQPVPATSAATGVDDAASPGLTDAAERDYFRLRSRAALALKQLAGLQDYVRQQCLNPNNKGDNHE
ncbi:lysis protein [Enterobacteriaceae bacterium H16N7]|nr:lysis protein [Dryocola clanedunensis]